MSQQQQQQQPVTVEDALKLFNEVQQLTVRDAMDSERFTAATPSGTNQSAAQHSNNSRSTAGGRSGSNAGGGGRVGAGSGPYTVEADLRRQLELSEAVMKKLHAKNKALQQEVDDLRGGGGGGAAAVRGGVGSGTPRGTPRGSAGPSTRADADQQQHQHQALLKQKVAEQDATIKQLQNELDRCKSRPPLAASSSSNANSEVVDGSTREVRLLQKRLGQLQQQYDQLVDAKLECIREGESTGRVNKEVKSFFVASRQKMLDDAAFHEAERVLLNERLAKLEAEVLTLRTRGM